MSYLYLILTMGFLFVSAYSFSNLKKGRVCLQDLEPNWKSQGEHRSLRGLMDKASVS